MEGGYEYVKEEKTNLYKEWGNSVKDLLYIFNPPSTAIRNYFGEKIAYYFDFLGLYSRYLLVVPIPGLTLFILFIVLDSDHVVNKIMYIVYAVITILWTTIFLEHLKRKSNAKAIEWGQSELEEDEIIRPQFVGKSRRSPVNDDLQEPWYPMFKRVFKVSVTSLVLFIVICISGGFSALLFWLRYYLAD